MIPLPERNDPCWCGSGKKYKKCHMNREQMGGVPFHVMLNRFKTVYSKKYCSHPNKKECNGPIVNAHTVPKSGSLKQIAISGKVYQFRADLTLLLKNSGNFQEQLIGVNDASTFTGFCAFHDNEIFEPLEKHKFEANEQIAFLLAYRAYARELFTKDRQVALLPQLRDADSGLSEMHQRTLQEYISSTHLGASEALTQLNKRKTILDQVLISHQFHRMRYYMLILDKAPEVMSSGAIYAEYDFHGKQLQPTPFIGSDSDSFAFSSIGTESGGAIVFSWIGERNNACSSFAGSLHRLSHKEQGDAIVRFLLTFSENVFFSPPWWDQLGFAEKASIRQRVKSGTNFTNLPAQSCLKDDGFRFVSWNIVGTASNIALP